MKKYLFLVFSAVFTIPTFAQLPVSLKLPEASPKETRSITIGLTKLDFEYNSVGIKGRDIWGGLVPYGEVWRTGANKNTTISFSDDVLINGEKLKAGKYGFHTIPGENEWTLIFSEFSEAWGSYFYDESEDALRVKVIAEPMSSKYEWLKFAFSEYTDVSVTVELKWAHLKVPFTVTVPKEVTFANIENQFRSLPAFSWQGWYQGANYTLTNNYEVEKGLEWAKQAVKREQNIDTISMLGKLEAVNGNKKEAIVVAEKLTESWVENWKSYFLSAEIYETIQETKKAELAYKKANELAESESIKEMIQSRLNKLQ